MNKVSDLIQKYLGTIKPLPAGIYHYQSPANAEKPYRMHLRLENDGSGVLIINASTVLHLNQTAAEYAYHIIKGSTEEQVVAEMVKRFNVSEAQALEDYHELAGKIETLIQTPDLDPVSFLGFDRVTPYSKDLLAPYRLDCALTYRQEGGSEQASTPQERVKRELSTEEWKIILEKAWQVGIPHVVFTGGEPTLRDDLLDLIKEAERLGIVTGLLTNGYRLVEKKYFQSLLLSGLDHIMMLAHLSEERFWRAAESVASADIHLTVHITLTSQNKKDIVDAIPRLNQLGVNSLSLSTDDPALQEDLITLKEFAQENKLPLVWDIPVPYSDCHPIAMEIRGEQDPLVEGAGKAWLYVEPDGDVLPAQGINMVMGNLLHDDWDVIWKRHR